MSIADRLRNAAPSSSEDSTYWNPETAGEMVAGTVTRVSTWDVKGENPRTVPQVVIKSEEDGKEYTVTAFRSVLEKELTSARPAVGDELGIRFDGKPEGKRYFKYTVIHTPAAGSAPASTPF